MASEFSIKAQAGYVQVEGFSDAGAGYFCGTCRAFDWDGGHDGFCTGLQVNVRTYGCCNNWKLEDDAHVRGANGRRLRVVG